MFRFRNQSFASAQQAIESAETVDCSEKQAIESAETVDCSEKQAIESAETVDCSEKQAIAGLNVSQTTKKHMSKLLASIGMEGIFGRTEVAKILEITVSPAGELINKMKSAGLIEAVSGFGKGKYKFIRK